MYLLEEMICHLSADERRRYRLYTANDKGTIERKLFDLYTKNPLAGKSGAMKLLYKNESKTGAYTASRLRLINRIVEFVAHDLAIVIEDPRALVMVYVLVAYKYHHAKAWAVVRHFSLKAESMCITYRMYALLEGVYNFMIQNAADLDVDFRELLQKQQINGARFDRIRALNAAGTEMEIEVRAAKQQGQVLEPEIIFHQMTEKYSLSAEEQVDPAFRLRVLRIFRTALLSAKRYVELDELIITTYNELTAADAFSGPAGEDELNLLYMLAHSKYRNKQFAAAMDILTRFKERSTNISWTPWVLILKTKSLEAAILVYTGKNDIAIANLEELRKERPHEHYVREWLNIDLGLAVYYFNAGQFRKAIGLLNELHLPEVNADDWMGKEWCFKMDLIEIITHNEQGNDDLVVQYLRRLKKHYKDLLRSKPYANAARFVDMCTKVMGDPNIIDEPAFRNKVRDMIGHWELDISDLQAVTFFCWLKSKLHKLPYYELLIEEVNKAIGSMEGKSGPTEA